VIAAVLAEATVSRALKMARCSRSTFYDWMERDAVFAAELRRQRSVLYEETLHRLKGRATAAVDVLEKLLGSDEEKIRLAASRTILEAARFAHMDLDMEARIAALERSAHESGT